LITKVSVESSSKVTPFFTKMNLTVSPAVSPPIEI